MSVYYCESCLTNQTKYIDGGSLPITINNGQPNVGFDIGTGFNGNVLTSQVQQDGKILVGGFFEKYSGTPVGYSLIRLNTDGSIDTSFDVGTGFYNNSYGFLGEIYSIQIQSDGKIIVGGGFDEYSGTSVGNSLIRLETDGSIDTSFDVGTGFSIDGYVGYIQSIQIQSDGKILVAGGFDEYSGTSVGYSLIRLNTDGSIDTSFDVGTGFSNFGVIRSTQIQSDGKILVGGTFNEYSGTSVGNNLIRLESDGTIDTSFDVGSGFNNGEVYSIQIQSDGKIIVGGYFDEYSGTSVGYSLIRLESDGSIDTSFDVGTGFSYFGGTSYIQSIQIQSDGKILVGGSFDEYSGTSVGNNLIRLESDGSIDTSFDVGSGFNGDVYSIQIQSDGKILVVGSFTVFNNYVSGNICLINPNLTTSIIYTTDFRCYTPEFLIDNLIDESFVTYLNNSFDLVTITTTKTQSDGKILVSGNFTQYGGLSYNGIIRLNTDGTIDTSFDVGTGFNYFSGVGYIPSIQLQSDGKILVGGQFTSYSGVSRNRIIRLNTDGSIDTSFSIGTGFNGFVQTIELQPDGKILVGGAFTTYSGVSRNYIIRLNTDGSIDTSFVIGSGFNNQVQTIQLQPDGKILVGGYFKLYNNSYEFNIIRLNEDGSLDVSYNTGAGFDGYVNTIQLKSDGKILVGGVFSGYNGVYSGNLNINFSSSTVSTVYTSIKGSDDGLYIGFTNGIRKMDSSGTTLFQSSTNNDVLSLEELSDSNILVAGSFGTFNGSLNGGLVKVDTLGDKVDGFNVGYGFGGFNVYATKELPSGKFLVGGDFTLLGSSILDITFNIDSGFNNQVLTAVEQPDGKILVGGDFFIYSGVNSSRIIRLNTDGSIDTSFVIGSGFSSIIYSIQLQSDGKILVGGSFTSYSGVTRNRIIRLNTDGSIDTSFVIGTGFTSTVRSIQLQSDGKILVGGDFTTYSGVSYNRIIRLNTDGSIDTGFVIGTGFTSTVNTVQLQSDGKILVGGSFTSYSGVTRNRIIRLNTDGSVDTSFVIGTGFTSTVLTIQLQSDGKILVGGGFTFYSGVSRNYIIRLNTDGSVDTSFVIGTGFNSTVNTVQLQSDGKILVGGIFTSYSGVTRNRIIRLNTDGSVDTSFVIGTGANDTVRGFIPSTGFTFLYGEFTTINGISQNYFSKVNYSGSTGIVVNRFTRLNSDGSYDTTFSANTGFTSTVRKIDTQPDNKIIIAGDFTSYSGQQTNRILRLNTDYTLDTSFDTANIFDGNVNDFEILSDGKILVGGSFTNSTSINSGFNTDALFSVEQPDGKILVGGNFISYNGVSYNRIIRLNSGGTIDTSFVIGTGFTSSSSVRTISLQPDGKILVGGTFTSYSGVTRNRIIRLNTDGSVDTSFVIGTGFNSSVNTIQLQPDGKILVGGEFSSYSGVSRSRIIRLNTDGSVDTSFVIGTGFNADVQTIQLQSDGKILVGGSFTSYSGVTRNRIIRLNTDGSVDTSFVIGTGFSTTVSVILFNTLIGGIIVGGNFTSYNGTNRTRLAKLNSDGSIDTSFLSNSTFNSLVTTISIGPNSGFLLIGGSFSGGFRIVSSSTNNIFFTPSPGFNTTVRHISIKLIPSTPYVNAIICGSFISYDGITQRYISVIKLVGSYDINPNFNAVGLGRIALLNNDGTIDINFNPNTDFNVNQGFNSIVNDIKIESDGKILVGGSFSEFGMFGSNKIARLTSGGTYDDTFVVGTGFNGASANTITQVSDELVLIGGIFNSYDNLPINNICQLYLQTISGIPFSNFAVLNLDGSADTTVNLGTGFNGTVTTIELQSDGKILVGGGFTSYSGVSSNRIIRLNTDYTNDSSFNVGNSFYLSNITDSYINTIELQPNGKIMVGGLFNVVNNKISNGIAQLFEEIPTAEYQAMFLFDDCEVCNGYVIPISANTEYDECRICNDVAVSVDPPHPVWTGLNGGSVTQMNAVLLGGNGLNS